LAAVGDVGGDGVDPVEGIESANGRAGAGIGRCRDLEQVVMPADAIGRDRRAGDVARESLELLAVLRGERLSGEDGKTGMDPGETRLHEPLRETLLFVEAVKNKPAKHFANSRAIDGWETEELSFCRPDPIGNDGVAMRIEVGPIRTERLNRGDAAGPNVFAGKQRLEGSADGP
jgi:hypothetical protein